MARAPRGPKPGKPDKPGRVGMHLFDRVLNDPNPVIRYGFAALLFFGPLYLMASYGMKGAHLIAWAGFLGILFYRQKTGGLSFS